ncbi:Uncharacterized protein dnm_033820 [Desulfonema magnum]|uniref:Uncharacterized protein n=1 Tax=Desulfonema magnum TaxID=45655 RepID=A0A975BKZ5_9BACT|nr:Uncharacterized protein dnm_033820 [Desulfonema magnum]
MFQKIWDLGFGIWICYFHFIRLVIGNALVSIAIKSDIHV